MEKVYLVTENIGIRCGIVGVFTNEDTAEAYIRSYEMDKRDDIRYTITPMTFDFPKNDVDGLYPFA